jgi:hypothetical protein
MKEGREIKMDLQKLGCGGVDWIELTQDRAPVVGACECGNETSGSMKYGVFLKWMQTG